jgi:predicted RNA-binding Zn-ribbon protein involved in translation (DUF1610 family)
MRPDAHGIEDTMSSKEVQRIRCPKCGAEHDFAIWTRINTDLDPDLDKKVRSGELFRTVCPSCGQQIDVVYPCLYHQMKNKVMIYYAPGREAMAKAAEAFEDGLEEAGEKRSFDARKEGYRNRVVGSLYDLQEKIAVFASGLDDRVVEICKVLIGSELQESQPDAAFDDLLYYRSGSGEDRLALMKESNAFASISLPGDIYEEVKRRYQPLIDQYGNETIIDMEWVMNSVTKAEGR